MSVAEDIHLIGKWNHGQGHLEFLPDLHFEKIEKGVKSSGTYRLELDAEIGSLVLKLLPEDGYLQRYTFNLVLNNEGTFLTLFWPQHQMVAEYKREEEQV